MALIAHYPLNGDLLDHSGKNNNLQYLNNNNKLNISNGKTGLCYKRDTVNSGADAFRSINKINLQGDFTFACWAFITDVHAGTANGLMTNHSHSDNSGAGITVREINSSDYRISCNTGTGSSRTYNTYYGTTNIKDAWSHLLLKFIKSTKELSLWVNGNKEFSTSYDMYNIEDYIDIFSWSTTYITANSYRPASSICDVRVYDHALSQKEILELSKAKVLHYKFNEFKEPTENIAPDISQFVAANHASRTSFSLTDNIAKFTCIDLSSGGDTAFHLKGTVPQVEALQKYTFSFYARSIGLSSFDKREGTSYRWNIQWLDAGGVSLGYSLPETISLTSGWKLFSMTGTSLANSTSAMISIGADIPNFTSVGSYVEIKDIQLEKKPYATPYTPNTREAKIIDLSGLENHSDLALDTTPKWVEDSPIGGGSYEFNGTSSNYLTLPHSTINLPSLKNCSISFWRKKTSSGNWLLLQGGTSGGDNYIMATASGTGDFYHNNVGNNWEIFVDAIPRPNPIDDTEWHHYVIRDVNLSSWTQLLLNNYASWYFRGILSDLRIYNSVLSDKDIKELYKNRMNIDDEGNVSIHNMSETGHVPLIMDYTTWEEGQVGSIGKFSVYTNSAGNRRVKTDDPWGKQSVVWQGETTESNIAGSGIYFSSSTPIDKTKLYRFSWWERRVSNSTTTAGSYYAGLNGYPDGVLPLDSNTPTTNPYFYSVSYSGLPIGQWFLVVGHVYPYTKEVVAKTVEHKDSGRWKVDGTKLGSISGDFRWMSNTTTGRSRSLMIYQPNAAGMIHQTAFPRMDICDGTEPSLSELLAGFDRNYIEKIKKDGGASKAIIEISKTNNYSREISEVGPVDGLVAWYPLNYDTLDYSGNGNHGINNGATPVAGLNGGAYYFNNSSYIRLPQEFSVDSYTISMWFKRDSFEGDSYGNLIGTQTDERSNDKGFQIPTKQSSTQSGRCYLYNSSVISKTFEAGEWFFVSITKTPEITKMFWNGEFHNSEATQTRSLFTKLDIGQWNGSERYLGFIQDVRIYDRALTEEEIKILYELRKNKNTLFTERGEIYLPGELDETY